MSIITETSCHYLFNKEAGDIFAAQDETFINKSLTTLMRVIDRLIVSNPNALFIFDPTAYNNQCHLYALFVAQGVREAKNPNGDPEKIDRRILYHSAFLSYAFITNPTLFEKLVCKTLKEMKEEEPSKAFRDFVKDPKNMRAPASRTSLLELFKIHMTKLFSSQTGGLESELGQIAKEDLMLLASNGKGSVYTFPKLAGVAYMLDAFVKEQIPFLFKVKIMTEKGNGSFSYSEYSLKELDPDAPVVVFEMIATGKTLSYTDCQVIAKKCPSHSRRNVQSDERHDPKKTCEFCTKETIDLQDYEDYKEKFLSVLKTTDELFYALGVDFVCQKQASFLKFFENKEQTPSQFPMLTALFNQYKGKVKDYRLSLSEPMNMSVSHTYTDCAARAFEDSLVIDANYKTHFTIRGLE